MFDPERQRWLTEALENSGTRPTVVAMHHPPFPSGIHWMDTTRLQGWKLFSEIVGRRSNVVRILCGHLHRPLTTTIAGVTTTVAPSTIHHVELNLDPQARVELIRDPAGYQLHNYIDDIWVSHIRYIDTGEIPVVPAWSN
jgi:Icc-related predicted phosphoesterase